MVKAIIYPTGGASIANSQLGKGRGATLIAIADPGTLALPMREGEGLFPACVPESAIGHSDLY
uniref:Uncharacterized protein n=1 Tax=Picea glauca TaxID=3330 RepID=A0A101LVY1_PICGL|nr:hypothetical protein ABT39_MTgene1852 [Picea glauca]